MIYLTQYIFYAIPLATIGLFIVSLVLYLSARKRDRLSPGSVSPEKLIKLRLLLTFSSIVAGVLALTVIGLMALLFMAVAFM